MMQFDENVVVYDAMRIIRERVPDAAQGQGTVPSVIYTSIS